MAGLMTHQYKKLPVTIKIWMQFNVMPRMQEFLKKQSYSSFMKALIALSEQASLT